MAGVRKNGKAYDSGDVLVNLLGQQEDEVAEIEYTTEQAHQLNYSLSNEATSWSMGQIGRTARIVLHMNAAKKIEKAVPDGDLLKIAPFDINVTFVNEFNDIVNDTLTVKFMNQGRSVTGQMGIRQEYQLFVLGISYNNA